MGFLSTIDDAIDSVKGFANTLGAGGDLVSAVGLEKTAQLTGYYQKNGEDFKAIGEALGFEGEAGGDQLKEFTEAVKADPALADKAMYVFENVDIQGLRETLDNNPDLASSLKSSLQAGAEDGAEPSIADQINQLHGYVKDNPELDDQLIDYVGQEGGTSNLPDGFAGALMEASQSDPALLGKAMELSKAEGFNELIGKIQGNEALGEALGATGGGEISPDDIAGMINGFSERVGSDPDYFNKANGLYDKYEGAITSGSGFLAGGIGLLGGGAAAGGLANAPDMLDQAMQMDSVLGGLSDGTLFDNIGDKITEAFPGELGASISGFLDGFDLGGILESIMEFLGPLGEQLQSALTGITAPEEAVSSDPENPALTTTADPASPAATAATTPDPNDPNNQQQTPGVTTPGLSPSTMG